MNSLERHHLDEPSDALVPQLDHLLELSELLVAVDNAILDDYELVRGTIDLEDSVGVKRGLIGGEDVETTARKTERMERR